MKSNNIQSKIHQIYAAQDRLCDARTALSATTSELNTVNSQLNTLNAANQTIAEKYKISAESFTVLETPGVPTAPAGGNGGSGGGGTGTTDKFADEYGGELENISDNRESSDFNFRVVVTGQPQNSEKSF